MIVRALAALAILLLVTAFAACGDGETPTADDSADAATPTGTTSATPAPSDADAAGDTAAPTATAVAQRSPSATRSFSLNSVAPDAAVTITIDVADYGGSGRVTETLPDGFAYKSTTLGDSQVDAGSGQVVTFTLRGSSSFTYVVTASTVPGPHHFSGTLTDSRRNDHTVGGEAMVAVQSPAVAVTADEPDIDHYLEFLDEACLDPDEAEETWGGTARYLEGAIPKLEGRRAPEELGDYVEAIVEVMKVALEYAKEQGLDTRLDEDPEWAAFFQSPEFQAAMVPLNEAQAALDPNLARAVQDAGC